MLLQNEPAEKKTFLWLEPTLHGFCATVAHTNAFQYGQSAKYCDGQNYGQNSCGNLEINVQSKTLNIGDMLAYKTNSERLSELHPPHLHHGQDHLPPRLRVQSHSIQNLLVEYTIFSFRRMNTDNHRLVMFNMKCHGTAVNASRFAHLHFGHRSSPLSTFSLV